MHRPLPEAVKMSGYNATYWSKRIPQYLAEDWSHRPTPFAKLAANYFPSNGRILELGAGAGQDGLWFASLGFDVVISDGRDIGFNEIKKRAREYDLASVQILKVDIMDPFPFESNSFDGVYAQIVLNYFNDETTMRIIGEIQRILKPRGVLACMVNSTKDHEYDASKLNKDGLIEVKGLMKRYFTKESLALFVQDFEELLFNEEGRTPKDDIVGTTDLIQFIGRKVDR